MSESKKPDSASKVDAELSELLDSALEDFKSEPPKDSKPAPPQDEIPDVEWSDDFIRQAAAQFESNFANLLGSNPDGSQLTPEQIQAKFQQMAETAQQVIENPSGDSGDFAATISQTLQGLSQGAEGLQNPNLEQDIMNLFAGQGDQNAFMPFMQGMMQSLLSKDVLYPSLKDILDKFPEWLSKNKDKLSQEDAERYEKQQKLMEEICAELEKEKESDSSEQKKERFDKVLSLMQKLQDYGQPPTDLVGDVGPPLPLEMQNNADPNQCNVM
ncbi:peroxisomal biogenesis factor 19 [Tribolium castaneum]|uniref:Peroxin-19 n=1 Tax=Tribolium castaneum TaxID=7070 RepID=D2A5I0_TRICA|nr:PREDICTED: peroxisomal biogenesis factor 19 [Tribolium castaneum]EFA05071.1 Peroxisomal biogenesis factor 19-like Protein [Tribolium castaneum]|eukprot:XP_968216.1 PREDICTED: peroxisomal biogenesis factor 19 [Tribolium castaneum]